MPRARTQRYVLVNVMPYGKVHEEDCNWLNGAWNRKLSRKNYRRMLATQVPKGKEHCSRC